MEVQKAKHLYVELDKKTPTLVKKYMVFEKYDGWYGYIDIDGHNVSAVCSRAGRHIPSMLTFLQDFVKEVNLDLNFQGRLIFEILIDGVTEFSELNGILNRSKGDCQAERAYVMCHDFIPTHNSTVPAWIRYSYLDNLIKEPYWGRVQVAPLQTNMEFPGVTTQLSLEQAKVVCEDIWSRGGEGIILKDPDAVYHPGKRNSTLMKIKEELTLDLEVVDVEEGRGKYEGTLGTLTVRDRSGRHYSVSGMTDEQRDEWWRCSESIIGSVVEVKAMKRLKDGSLREPRFKAVRHDKTGEDID